MPKHINKFTRRSVLKGASIMAVGCPFAAVFGSPTRRESTLELASRESIEKRGELTSRQIVDALEGAYGHHPAQRRNHTKGVGALGHFVGNPDIRSYCRSPLFSGSSIPVVARFSIAGGNPDASDAERSPRGLAIEFRLPGGGLHHMTMIHTPMFFAAVPQTFLDKFVALALDPATGKPDIAKFRGFVESHPDNAAQATFLKNNNPPWSYATSAFYGIHAFKFLNADNRSSLVKFRFVPRDGERQILGSEIDALPRDFLAGRLAERSAAGPILWDMMVTIGEPGDPETNPTLPWPADRKQVRAGTLVLESITPSAEAGSYLINYDPLVMHDGIEATADPVLFVRSSSYALSYTRRLQGV